MNCLGMRNDIKMKHLVSLLGWLASAVRLLISASFCMAFNTGSAEAAIVTLEISDVEGFSSFDSGDNWSDGLAPRAGNEYEVKGRSFRLPDSAGSHSFAGDSLTLDGVFVEIEEGTGGQTYDLTVRELHMNMAQIHVSRDGGATLRGKLGVHGYDNFLVAGITDNPRPLTVHASLTGAGELKILSNDSHSYISLIADGYSDFAGGATFMGGGYAEILGDGALGSAISVSINDSILVRTGGGVVNDYFPDTTILILVTDEATLLLDYDGIDQVGQVFVRGRGFLSPGLYGAEDNPLAEFTDPHLRGSGLLRVIPEPGTVAMLLPAIGFPLLRRRRMATGSDGFSGA